MKKASSFGGISEKYKCSSVKVWILLWAWIHILFYKGYIDTILALKSSQFGKDILLIS